MFFLSMKVLYGRFLCKKDLSTNYDVVGRNKKKHFNVDLNLYALILRIVYYLLHI